MTVSLGAIIKGGNVDVMNGGTLQATDTTFTSQGDDSAGGDTNGDGSASDPNSWDGITAELGSTVTISSSTIGRASPLQRSASGVPPR